MEMHRSSIAQVLHRAAVCVFWCLTLFWLASGVLECNFSPLQDRGKPSINSTTQCLSDQRCFAARGRYGGVHVLSSQGCVARQYCGSFKMVTYRVISINLTFTCCCRERCNQPPSPETAVVKLLGVTLGPVEASTTPTPDLCSEKTTSPTSDGV
ncbi:hypothetical protein AALO_G00155500 [Alosa alosa]|uniref:Uncharacterized protein n=1 Tax=Alosa alosa TaxID=278164 RepID=A0AAV6GJZ1_9TELE|nr:protein Bouncer-like [Alosa alosa]KAG5273786.1 hypothetical protein AALO_G00155500 [Alosa alosa]